MSKFRVTLLQRVLEQAIVIVEADTFVEAEQKVRDEVDEAVERSRFEYLEVSDRWVEYVEEIKESEDDQT